MKTCFKPENPLICVYVYATGYTQYRKKELHGEYVRNYLPPE